MKQTFITSHKLKNTYRVNSIIYSIKQLPILKKYLSDSLYSNEGLKILANVISVFIEIIKTFLFKFLYIAIVIFGLSQVYDNPQALNFLHIFVFFTFVGAILNTFMFNPSKDKYYALILMRMDAKSYTLTNYCYSLIQTFLGFLPFCIIFGLLAKLPLLITFSLPFFVIFSKVIFSAYTLIDFKKTKIAKNENLPSKIFWLIILILIVLALGLPYLKVTINLEIYLILFILLGFLAIKSLQIIKTFPFYKQMYKQLLNPQNVYVMSNANNVETIKQNVNKQIEFDASISSSKKGYAFFHELFIKRHRKILGKTIKKQMIYISIISIIGIIVTLTIPKTHKSINNIMMSSLPYFVFIMYLINRGQSITQAMFINCDHAMLSYKFYREPRVVLGIFKQRLKTLIGLNILPAFIIGITLVLLLYLSGGTNNILNYFVLFFSTICLSIFFSVHYLVMYYLLQPYNINTEIKSSTYKVVQFMTYFICYYMIELKLPTLYFGACAVIFCLLYSLISLIIIYRLAPKTFKIRL